MKNEKRYIQEDLFDSGQDLTLSDNLLRSSYLPEKVEKFRQLMEKLRHLRDLNEVIESRREKINQRYINKMRYWEKMIHEPTIKIIKRIDGIVSEPQKPKIAKKLRTDYVDLIFYFLNQLNKGGHEQFISDMKEKYQNERGDGSDIDQIMDEVFEEMFEKRSPHQNDEEGGESDYFDERAFSHQNEKPKKKTKKQLEAEKKQDELAHLSSMSIKEVYRKLVALLHPDLERDPVKREEKNNLMQKVNHAYEKNDILTLIDIQWEVGLSDLNSIINLDDGKINGYINIIAKNIKEAEAIRDNTVRQVNMLLDQRVTVNEVVDDRYINSIFEKKDKRSQVDVDFLNRAANIDLPPKEYCQFLKYHFIKSEEEELDNVLDMIINMQVVRSKKIDDGAGKSKKQSAKKPSQSKARK